MTTDEFSDCTVLVSVSAYDIFELSAACNITPGRLREGTDTVSENERINCEVFRFKLNPSSSGRTLSGTTSSTGRAISPVIASRGLLFISLTLPSSTAM